MKGCKCNAFLHIHKDENMLNRNAKNIPVKPMKSEDFDKDIDKIVGLDLDIEED